MYRVDICRSTTWCINSLLSLKRRPQLQRFDNCEWFAIAWFVRLLMPSPSELHKLQSHTCIWRVFKFWFMGSFVLICTYPCVTHLCWFSWFTTIRLGILNWLRPFSVEPWRCKIDSSNFGHDFVLILRLFWYFHLFFCITSKYFEILKRINFCLWKVI